MAGNSSRRGAIRKSGTKKGQVVGSGGQRRRGLEARGATPKAEDRPYHPAARKKKPAADERAGASRGAARGAGTARGAPASRGAAADRWAAPVSDELVAGRNPVLEVVRAGIPMAEVFLASGPQSDERIGEVLRTATALGTRVREISKGELDRLTDGARHQGIAVRVPPYEYADPGDLLSRSRVPLIVALDGVTDPHNLGAVLRSAGAFGVDGVVVPERRAAGVSAAVWKVSAGAAARVPVARATNLVRTLKEYQKAGCFVVGLDGGATTAVADLEVATEPLVVVTGSEGKGLSRLVRETCDAIAGIDIASRVESLNAAVATGIALYEIARIRTTR